MFLYSLMDKNGHCLSSILCFCSTTKQTTTPTPAVVGGRGVNIGIRNDGGAVVADKNDNNNNFDGKKRKEYLVTAASLIQFWLLLLLVSL